MKSSQEYNNITPEPSPDLTPSDVIRIQLAALQHNDEDDGGIATAFQFASPGNRVYTGPLSRFKQIVRNPAYSIMINHRLAELEPVTVSGDVAQQRVLVTGNDSQMVIYTFVLSRQRGDRFHGCWMTDGVSVDAMLWLN